MVSDSLVESKARCSEGGGSKAMEAKLKAEAEQRAVVEARLSAEREESGGPKRKQSSRLSGAKGWVEARLGAGERRQRAEAEAKLKAEAEQGAVVEARLSAEREEAKRRAEAEAKLKTQQRRETAKQAVLLAKLAPRGRVAAAARVTRRVVRKCSTHWQQKLICMEPTASLDSVKSSNSI